MRSWRIVNEVGRASDIHANPTFFLDQRTARFVEVTRSALVLGSSQDVRAVDRDALEALGAELVIRKSGGGAVYLLPHGQIWVDISVPRSDPLFSDDVGRSFLAIGEMFLKVLSNLGCNDLEMHSGRLTGGELSRTLCFAGLGPGEIAFEGAKILGMSQRRTAMGAVFQCTLYLSYPFDQLHRVMSQAGFEFPRRGYALGIAEILNEFADLAPVEAMTHLKNRLEEALETLA